MAPKRILVDGYNLSLEKGTGIATYARNLTYALKELDYDVDVLYGHALPPVALPQAREMTFFDPASFEENRWLRRLGQARAVFSLPGARTARPVPYTGMVVDAGFKARMPRFDRLLNADNLYTIANMVNAYTGRMWPVRVEGEQPAVAHWTFPTPIRIPGAKNIYTIHDLIPMRLPYTTLDKNQRFVRMVTRIAQSADHIVTVSETSKRDIVNLLGVPEERVTNTWQAVDLPARFLNKPMDAVTSELKGIFGLDTKRYYLFFGAIEPKKNLGRLIEAYLGSGIEDPLVVIGAEAWKAEQELRLLFDDHIRTLVQDGAETRVKRKVMRFGYAPFPLLVSLIRGAKAVVAPSLYEGFGLPALEAMLCGTPVITTSHGASPEIVGDAAMLVDPYRVDEIRDAMLALEASAEKRADYAERGRKRAQEFSEERYRKNLAEMYARL